MNVAFPTLDLSFMNLIGQMPEHSLLATKLSTEEVEEAVGTPANGKAILVADSVCGELSKLCLTVDFAVLKCSHNIVQTAAPVSSTTEMERRYHHGAVQEKGSTRVRQAAIAAFR